VLIPFLRASGYRYRPRFDFKHTGLGKTFRLAKWTLGFVLVTQAALVVVSKLASSATVGGRGRRADRLFQRVRDVDPARIP
jgi:putative peptidoglycan lipid II flippase